MLSVMTESTKTIDTELVARLRLSVSRLARRLRQQAEGDITPSGLSALAVIEKGPITLGDLAAGERVRPPSMTRIVAKLEESKLVVRTADENDGRVFRVALTPEGKKTIQQIRGRKNAYLARKLRSLSQEEVDALERAVGTLERILEEEGS
jgi:DNA-binding MarR family transcriptional regulator